MKKLLISTCSTMIIFSFSIIWPQTDGHFILYLFIFIIFMMPTLYYFYTDQKGVNSLLKIKRRRAKILKNGHYKYIINYVKEYNWEICQLELKQGFLNKNKINDCINEIDRQYVDSLNCLLLLLNNKGYKLKIGELLWLIKREIDRQKYLNFEKRILQNNPNEFKEYAENFIRYYKLDQNNIGCFIKLLNRKKIPFAKSKLGRDLEKISTEINLKNFESHLTTSDKQDLKSYIQ